MKKIKSILCILMAIMLATSCFVFSASALNPENNSVTLHITKYQIEQKNGSTDNIGTTSTLTGTPSDAPEGATTLANVEFTIFKLATLDTYISQDEIQAIDTSYNSSAKTVTYNGTAITGTSNTTNTEGVADFTVTGDEQGVYFVKETSSPEFVTAKAASFVVSLPMTNADNTGFMYDVYAYPKNYTTLGGGVLKMVDSSDNAAISGASFAVYKANGDQVTEDYYGNSIGDDTHHYLTTDSNGYIYVNNLMPGSYYFCATSAPEGYILNSNKYHFTVESGNSTKVENVDGQLSYEGIDLKTAYSATKPGISCYVTEIGRSADSVSFGELVRWYVVADIPSDMGSDYQSYTITIDMDEELDFVSSSLSVSAMLDGVEESVSESDYTVSAVENHRFTVTFTNFTALSVPEAIKILYKTRLNEQNTVMGEEVYSTAKLSYKTSVVDESVTVTNRPMIYTGGFKFKDVSAKDESIALSGAKFSIYTGDHNILIAQNVTSGSDGEFEIKGLTDGEYYLVQTEAPEGYELKKGKIYFTVSKTTYDNAEPLKVLNTPAYELPLTGGSGAAAFTVFGLALMALSAVVFAVSKKAERKSL